MSGKGLAALRRLSLCDWSQQAVACGRHREMCGWRAVAEGCRQLGAIVCPKLHWNLPVIALVSCMSHEDADTASVRLQSKTSAISLQSACFTGHSFWLWKQRSPVHVVLDHASLPLSDCSHLLTTAITGRLVVQWLGTGAGRSSRASWLCLETLMEPKWVQLHVVYIFQQAAAEDQLSVKEDTPTPHVLSSPPSLSCLSRTSWFQFCEKLQEFFAEGIQTLTDWAQRVWAHE